jgi:hypothetical protein
VSNRVFDHGFEMWVEIFKNPFKAFLIFPFLWYWLSLLGYKLFKQKQKAPEVQESTQIEEGQTEEMQAAAEQGDDGK